LTFTVFSRCLWNGFVNYDDPDYVYENPAVLAGLTAEGARWAFTTGHAANWHPLTWLSHMADIELFGLRPWGHHLGSVLLHAINSALLLLALHAMTGSLWRSAFAAAVFALHPLRVESVAWVSERKDGLSGLFFMLTLLAYLQHVRRPRPLSLAGVSVLFALGLMAKPMLVTLPFVLLLLDAWPLGRARNGRAAWPGLVREKIPLLLLAAASCVITILVQQQGEAVRTLAELSWLHRSANALVAYAAYLGMTLAPLGLATPYPHPGAAISLPLAAAAGLLLAGISLTVFHLRRRAPCLLTGWLWYLGMLVPVIGLVQVGGQAWADRYTYLPQIGLLIMLAWSLPQPSRTGPRRALALAAGLVLLGLALLAWRQIGFWRDSVALHTRALACTARNSVALSNLGEALDRAGRTQEALACYEAAAAIAPLDPNLHYNWGNALLKLDRPAEALRHYTFALPRHSPRNLDALHSNMGSAREALGDYAGAEDCFRRALALAPDVATTHFNLGSVLGRLGRNEEAIDHLREAARLDPRDPDTLVNLAILLARTGRTNEAAQYRQTAIVRARDVGNGELADSLARTPLPRPAPGPTGGISP
jgi:tetratricopeptide (TPR) repeat protein